MQELTAETLAKELREHIENEMSETDPDRRNIVIDDALYRIEYIADFRHTDEDLRRELRHFIEQYLFNKDELEYDEEICQGYRENEVLDAFYTAQEIAGRYLDKKYGRHDYVVA